jgi:hypothetical protein
MLSWRETLHLEIQLRIYDEKRCTTDSLDKYVFQTLPCNLIDLEVESHMSSTEGQLHTILNISDRAKQ